MKLLKVFFLDKRILLMKSFQFLMMDITKPCTHLHPAPSTTTQLISTSTQLHQPPPSSIQPPPSSLQHHQQYLNENIGRNWAISPNLGQKIKSYPFWQKIGTHGILEVFILTKSRLRFLKFRPQNQFLIKVGPKNSKLFVLSENWWPQYLKDADSKPGLRIFKFRPQNTFLGKFWSKKSKLFVFPKNWHAWHLDDADSYSSISFQNYQP